MTKLTRRSFFASTAAIPFSIWLQEHAAAQGSAMCVRYEARTAQGREMLKLYADAVNVMKAKPENDPTGWLFQWYTHWVRSDRTKAAEIARVYPSPNPQRSLAEETWETCQAHNPATDDENMFLPWHR